MSNNASFDKLSQIEGPITLERFILMNWWGQKTIHDLEGEDLCEIEDFKQKLRELSGETDEDDEA